MAKKKVWEEWKDKYEEEKESKEWWMDQFANLKKELNQKTEQVENLSIGMPRVWLTPLEWADVIGEIDRGLRVINRDKTGLPELRERIVKQLNIIEL
jgi:aspartate/methionine/tyrosine aminotransferase